MRPPLVSPQEIIEAGEALRGAGRPVSGHSLRQHIGKGKPARLFQVWTDATQDDDDDDDEPNVIIKRMIGLDRQLAAALQELESERKRADGAHAEIEAEKKRHAMTQLVVNAVSDELNKSKLVISSLESKSREQEKRITDLYARIDEQRSELNRSERNCHSLQTAIEKIQAK